MVLHTIYTVHGGDCFYLYIFSSADGWRVHSAYPQNLHKHQHWSNGLPRASDNHCSALSGSSTTPVNAYVTCCESSDISLSCITIWSGAVRNVLTYSLQCPETGDYFMTSCTGGYDFNSFFNTSSLRISYK